MKKLLYIVFAMMLIVGCDSDSSNDSFIESNGSDGQGGSLAIFALVGDYLYGVDYEGLNVFNISAPNDPVKVNEVNISFDIETLFSYGEYLYIGSQNGMYIYSIENPEFPQFVAEATHLTGCDPVVASQNTAYVILWSDLGCGNNANQLEIYDVTEITNPILLSTRGLTFPKGMGLYGDYLFVCDDEIKVFNVSDPTNTILVHNISRLAFDVIIRDNLLIAIGDNGLYQYRLDASNIENTTFLSSLEF
ncbi:MAG: LVIVD repeat-containing protein [Patiriisocius sp.]|uniref:LVIVD repeat-containing protein n=1 Tax=Patiriisocius sp. TaxID=2822396 RepID=UPI003EF4CC85